MLLPHRAQLAEEELFPRLFEYQPDGHKSHALSDSTRSPTMPTTQRMKPKQRVQPFLEQGIIT